MNLPDGTPLTLDTCGRQSALTLSRGEARFELKRSVPVCTVGSGTTVSHGTTAILSGT